MRPDPQSRWGGAALALTAWWSLLAAFLLPPLSYLGYPAYSLEYVTGALLALAAGALLSLSRAVPLLHRALLFFLGSLLVLLYYYGLAAPHGLLAAAIGVVLAAGFAALLVIDEGIALRVVAAGCLAQIVIAALAVPGEIVDEWDRNLSQSNRRPVVHILLDSHAGLAAIPQDARYVEAKRTLERRYLSAGFTLFPRAYSADDETRASLSRLFNPRAAKVLTGRAGTLTKAAALEQIGRDRALDITQFDYTQFDPWLLRYYLDAAAVRVMNASNHYPGIVRFGASIPDRLTIATAGAIWWTYLWSGFPAVRWAADHTSGGQAVLDWIGTAKLSYVYIARGALIDYRQRIKCCGQRGTYHFFHTYFPHGPYAFDQHCNAKPVAMWEAPPPLAEPGTAEAYRLRYEMHLEQALCASYDVMDIVKEIDRNPDIKDALIIIHGDHGSRIGPGASGRAELGYDEANRQRDQRGTFLAIRDGQKPASVVADDVRIDAVFEALVEADFESLDLTRVRRYSDSPY